MNKKILTVTMIAFCSLMLYIPACKKSNSDGNDGGNGGGNNNPPAGNCSGTPGALFTTVKNLVQEKCVSCHNSSNANGGVNFSDVCNIVAKKDRIKVRAVDEGTMPQTGPLSQADRDKITAWLNAGGGYGN